MGMPERNGMEGTQGMCSHRLCGCVPSAPPLLEKGTEMKSLVQPHYHEPLFTQIKYMPIAECEMSRAAARCDAPAA